MDHMNIRKAMESTDPASLVTPAPKIDPSIVPISDFSSQMSEKDKSQIFLFLMKKQLGVARFHELINECAQELEVYGLIENAEEVKAACNAIAMAHKTEKCSRPIMAIAMKIAAHDNSELSKKYMEIEEEEHRILNEISEKYNDTARKVYADLLNEFTRKAMIMNGPYAKHIQAIIAKARELN